MHKISKLGEGTYGKVYSCSRSGETVAVKRNFISNDLKDTIGSIRELYFLNLVRDHPFCITLLDSLTNPPFPMSPGNRDFADDRLLIVMEKGDMDGEEFFKSSRPDDDMLKFIIHTLLPLEFLHSRGIYHRDIKPSNVLCFMKDGKLDKAKITDFGLTQHRTLQELSLPGFVTLWYRAPELQLSKHYDCKVDVWSAGCVLFECFSLKHKRFITPETEEGLINSLLSKIYFSKEDYQLANELYPLKIARNYEVLQRTKRSFADQLERPVNNNVVSLLEKMLVADPNERYTISQCINHDLFKDYRKLINRTRAEFGISRDGRWIVKPESSWLYLKGDARSKGIERLKLIYSNRLNPSIAAWYTHRILFHALEMFDRYLVLTNTTIASNGDIVIWINTLLFISAKFFRMMTSDYGLKHFMAGVLPEQFTHFKQRAQGFEEFVVKNVFQYEIYKETLYETSQVVLSETGVAYLLKILFSEALPPGVSLSSILEGEYENLNRLNKNILRKG